MSSDSNNKPRNAGAFKRLPNGSYETLSGEPLFAGFDPTLDSPDDIEQMERCARCGALHMKGELVNVYGRKVCDICMGE